MCDKALKGEYFGSDFSLVLSFTIFCHSTWCFLVLSDWEWWLKHCFIVSMSLLDLFVNKTKLMCYLRWHDLVTKTFFWGSSWLKFSNLVKQLLSIWWFGMGIKQVIVRNSINSLMEKNEKRQIKKINTWVKSLIWFWQKYWIFILCMLLLKLWLKTIKLQMVLKREEFSSWIIQIQEGAPRSVSRMILNGSKCQRNLMS